MALAENSQGTIESMYAEVQTNGTPVQKVLADDLKYGYDNVGLGIEVSLRLHHEAMARLLEEVNAAN